MKPGDVAITHKFTDGSEFLGRVSAHADGRWQGWAVTDARGVIWRRGNSEVHPVAPSDPRLAAFLAAEAKRTGKYVSTVATPDGRALRHHLADATAGDEAQAGTLAERILVALAAGAVTAREIALRIDAQPTSCAERLIWLEAKGKVARSGGRDSARGPSTTCWRLAADEPPTAPLFERICAALGEGAETTVVLAARLGAHPTAVAARLCELERKGRVARRGSAVSERGHKIVVWALAS